MRLIGEWIVVVMVNYIGGTLESTAVSSSTTSPRTPFSTASQSPSAGTSSTHVSSSNTSVSSSAMPMFTSESTEDFDITSDVFSTPTTVTQVTTESTSITHSTEMSTKTTNPSTPATTLNADITSDISSTPTTVTQVTTESTSITHSTGMSTKTTNPSTPATTLYADITSDISSTPTTVTQVTTESTSITHSTGMSTKTTNPSTPATTLNADITSDISSTPTTVTQVTTESTSITHSTGMSTKTTNPSTPATTLNADITSDISSTPTTVTQVTTESTSITHSTEMSTKTTNPSTPATTLNADITSDISSTPTTVTQVTTESTSITHSTGMPTKTTNPSTTMTTATTDSTLTSTLASLATVNATDTMTATTELSTDAPDTTGTTPLTSGIQTTDLGTTTPTDFPSTPVNETTTTDFPSTLYNEIITTDLTSTPNNETPTTDLTSTPYNDTTTTDFPSTPDNETTTTDFPSTPDNGTTTTDVPSTHYNETPTTKLPTTHYNETTTTELPTTHYNETTTTQLPTTHYNETTTTQLPTTHYNETSTTELPTTHYNETSTTELPTTHYNETSTTELPTTHYNETTTTQLPTTHYNETTTTKLPTTHYNETTTTELPTTHYNETTTTELPTTHYNETTTTELPTTHYNETTTTDFPSTPNNETTTTDFPSAPNNESSTTDFPTTAFNESTTTVDKTSTSGPASTSPLTSSSTRSPSTFLATPPTSSITSTTVSTEPTSAAPLAIITVSTTQALLTTPEYISASIPNCPENTDSHGLKWNKSAPGEIATSVCKKGYNGKISRRCGNNGKWLLPIYNCVRKAIAVVDSKIEAIKDKPDVKEEDVLEALDALSDITKQDSDDTGPIYSGEITKVTSILDTIVNITDKVNVTDKQAQSFVDIASNLLNTDNTESWQSISQNQEDGDKEKESGASKILNVVSKYSDAIVKTLNSSKTNTTVTTDNLVLHVSKIDDKHEVKFPEKTKELNITCSFALSKEAVKGVKNYSAIVYRNISGIMSSKLASDSGDNTTHAINSAVISVHMGDYGKDFEIDITLGHLDQRSYTEPKCSFWNESLNAWSGQGCRPVNDMYNQTVCRCNHLTNFAILMSPWTESNVDTRAIDIISIVGCSISLVGLLVTIITHIVLWRYVRTDRVVLLMNLSVALILSYAVFVGGVDRTENKDVCTSIAVVLHYIYLVVFCLMLAEGIEIAITLVYVFTTQRSRLKWMIPCAWLLPAVIVGISIGATELEGYGTQQTCWLSVDHRGLIWAFVAPALIIILVNFVLLILAMKVMFGVRSLAQKSKAERVRAGVRCLCILVPLMGSTWVIGIFYVNESVAWIQYIFAVCNSLQGLVIFLFHCLLNKQIRIAIQKKRKLYYKSSMATKQTSKTFSMPRVSLSNSSLHNTDNSFGSYGSTGYEKVSAKSEKYELASKSVYRGNYSIPGYK